MEVMPERDCPCPDLPNPITSAWTHLSRHSNRTAQFTRLVCSLCGHRTTSKSGSPFLRMISLSVSHMFGAVSAGPSATGSLLTALEVAASCVEITNVWIFLKSMDPSALFTKDAERRMPVVAVLVFWTATTTFLATEKRRSTFFS